MHLLFYAINRSFVSQKETRRTGRQTDRQTDRIPSAGSWEKDIWNRGVTTKAYSAYRKAYILKTYFNWKQNNGSAECFALTDHFPEPTNNRFWGNDLLLSSRSIVATEMHKYMPGASFNEIDDLNQDLFMPWIIKSIQMNLYERIPYPCPDFKDGLCKYSWYTNIDRNIAHQLYSSTNAMCIPDISHHIARRHGPVIWMALHNEGDWWMDTYNHEPVRASDYMYSYTNPRVV